MIPVGEHVGVEMHEDGREGGLVFLSGMCRSFNEIGITVVRKLELGAFEATFIPWVRVRCVSYATRGYMDNA